jgi:hypothetical protein
MPIRFRCRYCNQLMGIARRKAGMTVNCPTCHAQVVVPPPEAEAQPEAPPSAPAVGEAPAPAPVEGAVPAPLFERSDFEAFLENPVHEAPPRAPEPPAPPPVAPAPSPFASESFAPPPLPLSSSAMRSPPAGLVLSPTQATWLTVVAILLLALAFGAGLLVGHYWMG